MRIEPSHASRAWSFSQACLMTAAMVIALCSFVSAADPSASDAAQKDASEIAIEARTIYGTEKDMVALCSKFDLQPFLTPPGEIKQASAEKVTLWPAKPGGMPPFRKVVLSQEETRELVEAAEAHQRLNLFFVPKLTTHSNTTAKISLAKSMVVSHLPPQDGQSAPVKAKKEIGLVIELCPTKLDDERTAISLMCDQIHAGPLKERWGYGDDGKPAKVQLPETLTVARAHTTTELAPGQSLLMTGFTRQEGKKPQAMAILLRVVK